jgi:tetratricopeptide (TPR) repeat protein
MKNKGLTRLIGAFAYLLVAAGIFAVAQQTATQSAAEQEANKFWQDQKWAEAAKAYEVLAKAQPANGQVWFRLGSSLVSLNRLEDSVLPLEKAAEILQGPMGFYTLGSVYAKLNNKDKAFDNLTKASAAGFGQINRLKNDPNLSTIRDDARFAAIVERVDRNAFPCKASPEARQLDFWVGEWDVQLNGQTVGNNIIQRIEDGCLILENWTAASGGSGKSMNFYNPVTKKWRQTYMSNKQVIWEMSGEYKDGAMYFEGEVHSLSGTVKTRVVLTPLPPDRIKHIEENSTDGGKTWTNVWDSIYVRRKPVGTALTK